jgi:replicative DNA helicase
MSENLIKKLKEAIKKELYKAPFELKEDYKKFLFDPSSNLTTCFPTFDRILRGKLRGLVGCSVGYGGSRKSLLALNLSLYNVQRSTSKTIYSSMEMSELAMLERILLLSTEPIEGIQFTRKIKDLAEENPNFLDGLFDQLKDTIGYNVVICSTSRMTCDQYKDVLTHYKENHGEPDILIVDGLSMMGGKGTENEVFTVNSGELKDLAKEFNIFVNVICHASRGANMHTRNLGPFIRGSEKILDNVDFAMYFSLCMDFDNMKSQHDPVYRNDKGWVRLWDKRGSGIIMDKIYNIDPLTLLIEESNEDPKDFEFVEDDPLKKKL